MSGTDCPSCNRDIGVWTVMKVGWPTLLKCPHCKAKICYEPIGWSMLLISMAVYIPLLILSMSLLETFLHFNVFVEIFVLILIATALWQPFEYLTVKRLRKRHKLIVRK